jgi:hypothetical protein
MLVIPATQEVDFGRIVVQGQLTKKLARFNLNKKSGMVEHI